MKNKNNAIKVLFAHDGPLLEDDEGNFYNFQLNNEVCRRYLHLGDKLTMVIRVQSLKKSETNNQAKIDNNLLDVINIPDFKSFSKYFKYRSVVNDKVEKAVLSHDVIMARLPSALGSLVVKYAKKHNKPIIAEVVACNWDSFWYYNWKGKMVAPYFYFKQKRVIKKLNYAIYVTKNYLQNLYPNTGKSINCSNVELKTIDDSALNMRLDKIKSQTQTSILTLGTIGALNVPYKAQHHVLNILYNLKKQGVIFKYKLVGQGDPSRLVNLAKKLEIDSQIEFVGTLNHNEVFDFLDEIDLYIHPSKQEGLPRAMIEAMSRALPVIGSRTAGIPELIDDEFIFDKGNEVQMMSILSRMDKETMLEQARKNFENSKCYLKPVLYKRRIKFFKTFLDDHNIEYSDEMKKSIKQLNL